MRDYARELSDQDTAPRRRLAGHYLHTALCAALLLEPNREPIPVDEPNDGVAVTSLADDSEAMAWLEAEYPCLLAVAEEAWQVAWALSTFQHRSGRLQDWIRTLRIGLAAATGNPLGEANLHRLLSSALLSASEPAQAKRHAHIAIEAFRALGDERGEARAHHNMAGILMEQKEYAAALSNGRRMKRLYHRAGHKPGEIRALNLIGWCYAHLGDTARAISLSCNALRDVGEDRYAAASTWDTLGYTYRLEGDLAESAQCYMQAADLYARIGDSYWLAEALRELGETHLAKGEHAQARSAWERALGLLDEKRHPHADRLRILLRRV